jgi:hypothetical protein
MSWATNWLPTGMAVWCLWVRAGGAIARSIEDADARSRALAGVARSLAEQANS